MKHIFSISILFLVSLTQAQFSEYNYKQFTQKQKEFTLPEGIKIAYIDEGKGDAILLLHGIPTSSWLYRKTIDSLVSHGKRVIIPDIIGFGQSDKPKEHKEYAYAKQAQRIMDLMEHLKIETWTHVCHDMGSMITWKMMDLDQEQKIVKLVVLNSILQENGFQPPVKFKKGFLGKRYSRIYCSGLGKSMIKATMNNGMYKQKINKQELNGYVKPLKKTGHHALYSFFTSFEEIENITDENEQRFNSFKGEITFIWGIHDEILTIKQVDHFLNHTNNEKTSVIHLGESGHFIQEQELINYIDKI